MDINAEVGEKVFGWEVDRAERLCRDPKEQGAGFLKKLPDFLMRDYELLRQTMKDRGYELTTTERPTDIQKGMGRMFTASFKSQTGTFQTTQSDERLAVCVAALIAHGFKISNDQ
jgi:hypothetical protein